MQIKITWKFFIWIAVVALSALPALFVNNAFGYVPSIAALLCGLLSWLMLLFLRRRMSYETSVAGGGCERGDTLRFGLLLHNRSWFPAVRIEAEFFIRGCNDTQPIKNNLRLSLRPREQRKMDYEVTFAHFGEYRVGLSQLTVYDLLGIWRLYAADGREYSAEVFPRVWPLEHAPISELSLSDSRMTQVQSPVSGMDYSSVREYAYGDTIKSIHWKLSAHLSGLVTKQLESYTNTGLSIVLDLRVPAHKEHETRLNTLDSLAEIAVSLGDFACRRGMDYDLFYLRADGKKQRLTPPSFRRLSGAAANWQLQAADTVKLRPDDLLRRDCGAIYAHTNVALVTAVADEPLLQALCELKQAGKTPLLYFVLPDTVYDREREAVLRPLRRLEEMRISYLVLSQANRLR